MICALLRKGIGGVCRLAVLCIYRSVTKAMGCFFDCFRVSVGVGGDRTRRRPRPHLVSSSSPRSKFTEPVAAENRLSKLFLSDEREESSSGDIESRGSGSLRVNKELRDEAKFLKACGTLTETPAEIRKAVSKLNASPPVDKDSEAWQFHSWLPNSSIEKLQLDKQIDEPSTPVRLGEEWGRGPVSSERTPTSCISNEQNTRGNSTSCIEISDAGSLQTAKIYANQTDNATFVSPWLSASNLQSRNKSVRFECDIDMPSSKGSSAGGFCQIPKTFESAGDLSASKLSPKPTPLKISDEMQTPGTVFPANIDILANGKTRIRSQYVYSALNPAGNTSQWNLKKEDEHNSHQLSHELKDCFEQSECATPKPEVAVKEASSAKDTEVEASLSAWLNPPSSSSDGNSNLDTVCNKNVRFGRTPVDRPIIGMVAAHWNENDDASHISPKWWDGNGIPNSTNKYKEDQKVSWHATPFEERLEKALSEESLTSHKKGVHGKPIVFDGLDESDTAVSQFQASTQSKSVVSF